MSRKATTAAARGRAYAEGKRTANARPRRGEGTRYTTARRPVSDRRQPPRPGRS